MRTMMVYHIHNIVESVWCGVVRWNVIPLDIIIIYGVCYVLLFVVAMDCC